MNLLEEFERFALNPDEYAIVGSGPAAVRGIRKNRDLDVLVLPDTWEELRNRPNIMQLSNTELTSANHDISFYKRWYGSPTDTLSMIDAAEVIDGFSFACLKHLLAYKRNMGRPKDIHDIKCVYDLLSNNETYH